MTANDFLTRHSITPHAQGHTPLFELRYMPQFFEGNTKHPMEPHLHDFYQIIWFRQGRGKHYVDFEAYDIVPDTLFFIPSGQVHWFEPCTDYEGVIIHFDANLLSDEQRSEALFLKYGIFNAFDSLPYYRICATCRQRLEYVLRGMEAEVAQPHSFAHTDYLKALLQMFLIEVERMGVNADRRKLDIMCYSDRMFVQFRQLLECHYTRLHSVKSYANLLGISTKTLGNYVQAAAHTTPIAMINARIILEAKRLLRHSDHKVKEIAYHLGFDEPSHFVKYFKHHAGQLPLAFRKGKVAPASP